MSIEDQDFEPGEDVTDAFERPKGKAGAVISVRLDGPMARRLFAAAEGKSETEFAREAIESSLQGSSRAPHQNRSA